MAPASVKLALKKLKSIYAARPRSLLEWYEFVRDDIILAPFFQVGTVICRLDRHSGAAASLHVPSVSLNSKVLARYGFSFVRRRLVH